MHGLRSSCTWEKILSCSCSSEAVNLASDLHPADLSESPLPTRPDQLSKRAFDNLVSVCRALEVHVDGLQNDFWSIWAESEDSGDESDSKNDRVLGIVKGGTSHVHGQASLKPHLERAISRNSSNGSDKDADKERGSHAAQQTNDIGEHLEVADSQKNSETPSAEDLKHASVLKQWGQQFAHQPPPEKSLYHVSHSVCFAMLLKEIVPPTSTPALRAAILGALAKDLPSSVAPIVQCQIIIPFLKQLQTPAPREMLSAILSFTSRHFRHVVAIFSTFSSQFHAISNGVAEILALIVPTVPQQVALDAFKLVASATWSEVTIPLVSAMTSRCQSSPAFLDLLVPALDRNAPHLDKSVRYGKLLFSLVSEVPQIRHSYKEPIEAICLRSKMFLAKRALTLLRSQSNPP